MFGHQENTPMQNTDTATTLNNAASQTVPVGTVSPAYTSAPPVSEPAPVDLSTPTAPSADDTSYTSPVETPAATPTLPAAETTPGDASDTDELLTIKQHALQQLTPLVDHLEQTPEEKFRTTMMMIQAADNQSLIQRAYEAAQSIPDEKVRAQALLDVVNEINYFTTRQTEG